MRVMTYEASSGWFTTSGLLKRGVSFFVYG